MGGRGSAYDSANRRIYPNQREYECIGKIGNIKILSWTKGKNNKTIIYSNTHNTTYFSANKDGRIENIYYFRNNRIVKSVDFRGNEKPHTHYWPQSGDGVGRKRHDPKNVFPLSDRDMRLWNAATKYNKEHGFKK